MFLIILMTTATFGGVTVVGPEKFMPEAKFQHVESPRDQLLKMQVKEIRRSRSSALRTLPDLRSIGTTVTPRNGVISGSITAPILPGDCMYDLEILALDRHGILAGSENQYFNGETQYEIPDLPDGEYYVFPLTVGWDDDTHLGELVHEFYDNATDWNQATLVTINGGGTASGINFDLASNSGYVEATIRNSSGQPLANTMVIFDLYPYPPAEHEDFESFFTEEYPLQRFHMTNANGELTVGPIPLGTFYMSARVANFGLIYYPNTPDPAAAQPLDLTTPEQTIAGLIFDLPPGGNIAGAVQLDTTDPAIGTLIEVYEVGNDMPIASGAVIDFVNGEYTVEGLPPGDYIVKADPSFIYPEYAPEYYDDKPTADTADLVTVIADQTTTDIDFTLSQAGGISGTVTVEAAGQFDSFFIVSAYDVNDSLNPIRFTIAEEGTEYTLGGLVAGDYKVSLMGIPFPIVPLFYEDAMSFEDGDVVTVTGTATTTGIDFLLPARGTIEGTVTLTVPGPDIDDVVDFVIAYPEELPLEGDIEAFAYLFPVPVDEGGEYRISGLPSGNYRVWVSTDFAEYAEIGYVPEYYGGAHNFVNATNVAVTEGSVTSNIDVELDQEAIVEGFIQLPDGSAASDEDLEVVVIAYDAQDGLPIGVGNIDNAPIYTGENNTFTGGFRIRHLPARETKIAAVPYGHASTVTYYGGGHTFDQGGSIVTTAGEFYPGDINIQLEQANQTISGWVTSADDGEPLNYVIVASYDLTGHLTGVSLSGLNMETWQEWAPGRYMIQSLANGSSHYVRTWSLMAWVEYVFLNPGADIIPADEWYDDIMAPLLPLEFGMFLPYGYYYFFGFMPFQIDIPEDATQVMAGSDNINFALGYQGLGTDDIIPVQTDLSVIEAWPNPASNIVTLKLNSDYSEGLRIDFMDLAGHVIHSIDGSAGPISNHLDVSIPSTLASGIYAIRVSDNVGLVAGHRLVILR